MTNLKTSLVALAAVLASTASASAADFYDPAPVASWTGFYAGVHGGYGWGDSSSTGVGPAINDIIDNELGGNDSLYDTSPEGVFGGLQAGYNFEVGSGFLLGLEATVSYGDISDSITDPFSAEPDDRISADIDWHGTVRGRAGAILGSTLVYGTGGFAWGQANVSMDAPAFPNESATLTGWVAGGGVEHKFSDSMSVKVEYLYTDYGSQSWFTGDPDGGNYELESDIDVHSVTVGLNFHL